MAKKRNVPKDPLTADELKKLSLPPHESLKDLSLGKGTPTDWYNVLFRITATEILCDIGYSADSAKAICEGRKLCQEIYLRESKKGNTTNWLVLPDTEYHILYDCLLAADQTQIEMDRSTQVYAYRKAYAKTVKYVRLFEKLVQQPMNNEEVKWDIKEKVTA